MILINLFLAVVVGGYIDSKKENEALISPAQMDEFLEKWAEYDPQGTGLLSPEDFAFLIHDLPPPLGLKDDNIRYEYDITGNLVFISTKISGKKKRGYLVSDNNKVILKKTQLFKDMKLYNIPVYMSKVHFSDACIIISHNAVAREYKLTEPLE